MTSIFWKIEFSKQLLSVGYLIRFIQDQNKTQNNVNRTLPGNLRAYILLALKCNLEALIKKFN